MGPQDFLGAFQALTPDLDQICKQATDLLPLIVGVKVGILPPYNPICIPLLRRIPEIESWADDPPC